MLAQRFNFRSVAEQNSLDLCFALLSEDRFARLRAALFDSSEEKERFRNLVINMVMATGK